MLVGIAGIVVRRERAGGFPVGDRRAAMLVGIAGVVRGRACAVGSCGFTRARAVVLVGAM